ncbi:MAG TPA: hypothetical protein VEW45_00275 [Candidatus Dormibacteraeota bacterium]|nr:hypothetical protein [Candidatus Dormibacteraeota bacterium]
MTMQHESHPHDERLAALAGADPQATDDRALRDHVTACDRCRAVVDDLALLRSALAELPDLRPSRPLQLLPPVAAPARPRAGLLGRLRRLSMPALAAGAALILVGAFGSTGVVENLGSAAGALYSNVGADLEGAGASAEGASAATPEATALRGLGGNDSAASAPPAASSAGEPGILTPEAETPTFMAAPTREGDDEGALSVTSDPFSGRLAWLVVLGLGVVLAVGSLLLRFTVQPRAG